MYKFSFIDKLSFILIIIGSLNWGLVGLFNFDLISFTSSTSIISRILYILVGLAGLNMLLFIFKARSKRK